MVSRNKTFNILDALAIFVNIAACSGNILLFWILRIESTIWMLMFVILFDLFYLILRYSLFSYYRKLKYTGPATIIHIIVFYNAFNVMLQRGNFLPLFEYSFLLLLFSIILNSTTNQLLCSYNYLYTRISSLSKGYIWISLISILGVFLSFILFKCGMSSYIDTYADIFDANIELGVRYYRSFFSVNNESATIRVPFFQDYGILCGLFHEPNNLTFNVFPCIFILIGLFYDKFLLKLSVILSAIAIVLFSGSTTNILVTITCVFLYYCFSFKENKFGVIISAFFLLAVIAIYLSSDTLLLETVAGRLESGNSSQEYSRDLLRFAFTPHTLFGTNCMSTSYVLGGSNSEDVGVIIFLLNIVFLLTFSKNIFLLLRSGDKLSMFVGIASLYYMLHSLKIGLTVYLQSMLIFLVYLQSIAILSNGRVKTIRRNS